MRCNNSASPGVIERCDLSRNEFVIDTRCNSNQYCLPPTTLDGDYTCDKRACNTPDALSCQMNVVLQCVINGAASKLVEKDDCNDGDRYCNPASDPVACEDRLCTKSGTTCVNNDVHICDTNRNYLEVIACNDSYCDPLELECVPRVCTVDGTRCNGNTLESCTTDNNTLNRQNCGSDYCDPLTLACEPRVCTSSGTQCIGNVLTTCDTTTNSRSELDCGANYCDPVALACVPRVCTTDGTVCDGNALEICDTSNNTLEKRS
ncbi:MAG: hypothetical protein ACOX8U_08845 [Bradymonadia bacterium]|jgi:hypothetical protein